jgi:fucose 4-O-acetylase-like acetyltransferase
MQQDRFDWIDSAKAALIFLVVAGHLHYTFAPVPGKDIIYAFHVPAFLVITGFLLPRDFGQTSPYELMRKWLGPYLRAYAFFSILALVIWWAARSLQAGEIVSPMSCIYGILYGVSGQEKLFQHHNSPLWYFPFLIVSLIGARVCAGLPLAMGWCLAVILAFAATIYTGPRLPWSLDVGGMGVLAVLAGHLLRQDWGRMRHLFEPRPRAAIMLVLSALALVAVSYLNGRTNINKANFGDSGLLFILGMASGFCATLAFSKLVPAWRISAAISKQTLTVFALHMYFVRAASLVPRPDNRFAQVIVIIALALIIIAVCMVLARLLQPLLDRVIFLRPRHTARQARDMLP